MMMTLDPLRHKSLRLRSKYQLWANWWWCWFHASRDAWILVAALATCFARSRTDSSLGETLVACPSSVLWGLPAICGNSARPLVAVNIEGFLPLEYYQPSRTSHSHTVIIADRVALCFRRICHSSASSGRSCIFFLMLCWSRSFNCSSPGVLLFSPQHWKAAHLE
jgi:hypothetical protein